MGDDSSRPLIAAIEAGGTKIICGLSSGLGDIRNRERIPTTTPDETIGRIIEFFRNEIAATGETPRALGIASFGPIDPDPGSATYGYITTTPKPGWANTDFMGRIRQALNLPGFMDTDVNGAAMAENLWGAGQGLDQLVYLTIGTGVGGGVIVEGAPVHGLVHPEIGHIRVPRSAIRPEFRGNCPFHGDCLEGLVAGPSIEACFQRPASELGDDHEAWRMVADHLALALNNLALTLSPKRIVLGGGVMHQEHLFPMIRQRLKDLLNGYIAHQTVLEQMDSFVVPPGLGDDAGLLGAVAIAHQGLRVDLPDQSS